MKNETLCKLSAQACGYRRFRAMLGDCRNFVWMHLEVSDWGEPFGVENEGLPEKKNAELWDIKLQIGVLLKLYLQPYSA
jgi:hypothetical protein